MTRSRPARIFVLTLMALAIGMMATPMSTLAQDDASADASSALPPHDQLASDAITRLALTAIREMGDPLRSDYRLTALALRIARRAWPDDAELLRLEIDAWDAADEESRAMASTRELVQLDPDNHVAWLRVINHNIDQLQSAEERLGAYARFLGPSGSRLDPAIRSRLALDAALIARETGDEELFAQRLTEATTLDVTNKNAAALYATYFSDRTDDPLIRVELLGNVLLADPLDPALLTNLAHELFRQRAFDGAARFFDRAEDVFIISEIPMDPEALFDRVLITWMVDGERLALDSIINLRDQQQAFLDADRRRVESIGLDPGPRREAHVPPIIELIRLAIGFGVQGSSVGGQPLYPGAQEPPERPEDASARREREARAALTLDDLVSDSLRRSVDLVNVQLELLENRDPPYDTMSDEAANNLTVATKLQLVLTRLWAGEEIDLAERDLDDISDAPDQAGISAQAIQRFRGLLAVRQGEASLANDPEAARRSFERGRALLEPLAEEDPVARLGMGILAEAEGRENDAIRHYAILARDSANSAMGCAARRRVETLMNRTLPQDSTAQALDQWALNFAPWLERMTAGPRRSMTLRAEHTARSVGPFERINVRIELRNISERPLALGPGATIESQMLLSPRVTIPGRRRSQLELPEVVDMDHRLRLMPGERLTTEIWMSRGTIGMLLDLNAHSSASLRWRILQGYRYDNDENLIHDPMSLTTETGLIERYDLPDIGDAQALADHIRQGQGDELVEGILLALVESAAQQPGLSEEQDLERRFLLAQAIVDRMPDLTPDLRAYTYAIALRGGMLLPGSPLREFAQDETHPLAQAALLIGALRREAGPFAQRLANSTDPEIRAMAQTVLDSAPPPEAE